MIGYNVSTPQGLTKFLTLLDWQEPGWQLDGPVTHYSGVGSRMTIVSPLMQFGRGDNWGPPLIRGTKLASLGHYIIKMESLVPMQPAVRRLMLVYNGKALSEDWSRLLTTFSYYGLVPHLHTWLSDHVIQLGSHRQKSLPITTSNTMAIYTARCK